MTSKPKPLPVAQIITELTGKLVGGIVYATHANGDVTILFGGLKLRAKPLTPGNILEIEQGQSHDLQRYR